MPGARSLSYASGRRRHLGKSSGKWLVYWIVAACLVRNTACQRFTSRLYNASVPENAHGNTVVISDEKMGMFLTRSPDQAIRYKIVSGDPDNLFKVTSKTIGNFCFLEIVIRTGRPKTLNRELKDIYRIKVKAMVKHANKSRTDIPGANAFVHITITDLNDIYPLFNSRTFRFEIEEDTPIYSAVGRVLAEDPDSGLNGQIYYSFETPSKLFAIHPTSGVITLTRKLNSQVKDQFELRVIAKNRGLQAPDFYSEAEAIFDVKPVNKFEPVVSINQLDEALTDGYLSILGIVTVFDEDSGVSGEIGSVEVEGDPNNIFKLIKGPKYNEYHLASLSAVDWSEFPYGFNLTVKATDRGIDRSL